jgi:hypothetical protein
MRQEQPKMDPISLKDLNITVIYEFMIIECTLAPESCIGFLS